MNNTFNAIILTSTPFSDSQTIVNCFSLEFGRIAIWVRRSKSKKATNPMAYTMPLTQIEGEVKLPEKRGILNVSGLRATHIYQSTYANPIKNSQFIFIAELLNIVLREEEPNPELYQYITKQLNHADESKSNYQTIHLTFILGLTKYLGFFPNNNYNSNNIYFNMLDGCFTPIFNNDCLQKELAHQFSQLIENVENNLPAQLTSDHSLMLLNTLISFYHIHITGFYTPKSLAVFSEINR